MNTIEKLQKHLSTAPVEYGQVISYKPIAPIIKCKDGTTLSVQASEGHYCSPRTDTGPYSEVEVWCITDSPTPVTEFEYDSEDPSAYVPITSVVAFIDNHGGMEN